MTTAGITVPDTTAVDTTTTTISTTTTIHRTCICGSPPSVANGEARFAGPYLNNTPASYDCDSGYTNSGGDSLLCLADSTCSNPTWSVDSTNTNSGYPDCQAVVPDNDVFNTYNTGGSSGLDGWALFAILFLLLLLLLLAVLLMLWYWLCRECCRRCCIKSCPCCRKCCYEIPYSHQPNKQQPAPVPVRQPTPPPQRPQPVHYVQESPEPQRIHHVVSEPPTVYAASTPPATRTPRGEAPQYSPVTPRKVIVVDRNDVDEEYYLKRLGFSPNSTAPPEHKGLNDFLKLEPREFVALRQDRIYKNEKPVDSRGNPLWMPHHKQLRVGANHINTSTK